MKDTFQHGHKTLSRLQWKTSVIFLMWLLLTINSCFAHIILETEKLALTMDNYLRTDLVTFRNTVDLDSSDKDDAAAYLATDYSLGFKSEFKDNGIKFYLKLESNGPYDYGAPVFIHNTLLTSGGRIENYRNDELLPQVEEFWVDIPAADNLRIKTGLYAYAVGNGLSLNGGYENYGFTISKESRDSIWRLYYCRPDINHKNHHLGPRIRQEEEQGILYEPNAANFFAADIKFCAGKSSVQPYVGVLADYTSQGKRDNQFAAPTNRDILGTAGIALNRGYDKLSLTFELAHNFGKAESSDPLYKDVYHTGYLIYTGLEYQADKFIPSFKFLAASGNKVTTDTAQNQDTVLTSGKNRAFSYHSPLNENLGDSISNINTDMLPIVAMGGGYGLNYGIPRPKTFASGDFENLLLPCLGFDFNFTEKFTIGVYGYYLSSFERGVGALNGEGKYLSRDLGKEIDIFLDYQFNQNILVSFLAGYFSPGRYYKEERDDTEGSVFNPFVRGDGSPDNAYQIELAVEFKF